ncbi:MAG: HEAT repeat domain-containing protein [Verrucomicrobia bacterium]|nr:HEAT repeat domain-containing protein [Verrucomicrobiota bacterium]
MTTFHLRRILRAALLGLALAALGGCSRSCSKSQPAPPELAESPTTIATNAGTAVSSAPVVSPVATPAALSNAAPELRTIAAPSASTPEQIQRVATLAQKYAAVTVFDDRFEVALQIAEVGGPEAVKTLETLFRTETDTALREELINALINIGDCKDEKLSLLRLGIAADQPASVREVAIDGLIDQQDERALALLKGLLNDRDEQIRALAQHAVELAEEMVKHR